MAGQPTAVVAVQTIVEGGSVRVSTPGGPIRLLDARPPQNWTVDEVEVVLERHQQRAGAMVAYVRAQVEATWERIRGELNRVAGGQASDRVMMLANYAQRASYAVELQARRAEVAIGEEHKGADAAVRDFAGLTAVAAARLNEAFTLAEAEGKRSQAGQTFNIMPGLTVPAGSTAPPFSPPGGVGLGPLPSKPDTSEPSPKDSHE